MTTTLLIDTDPAATAQGRPLSGENQRELAEANERAGKVRRAAKVATFNGWSIGIFAALSLPFALFSKTAFVMCIALGVVAYNEFRGRNLLRHFDESGARLLGWNQLGLMGLLIGYSLWSIYAGLTGPSPYSEQINAMPELGSMLGSIDDLYQTVTLAVYGSLIVFSVIFQGLNTLYYFTRERYVQAYLDQTPSWIVDLQRSVAAA